MGNWSFGEDRRARIFNGKDAVLGEVPWQAGITHNASTSIIDIFCGGALINPSWVLSAYHCFEGVLGLNAYWGLAPVWAVLGLIDRTQVSNTLVFSSKVDR